MKVVAKHDSYIFQQFDLQNLLEFIRASIKILQKEFTQTKMDFLTFFHHFVKRTLDKRK